MYKFEINHDKKINLKLHSTLKNRSRQYKEIKSNSLSYTTTTKILTIFLLKFPTENYSVTIYFHRCCD